MKGKISTWCFYDPSTGMFSGHTFTGHESVLEINGPSGHSPIEGKFDHLSQRIDLATGNVIDYQPPQPSFDHEWNADAKRWHLNAAAQQRNAARVAAMTRIAALEASQQRPLREIAIEPFHIDARKRLVAIEAEIAALRADMEVSHGDSSNSNTR